MAQVLFPTAIHDRKKTVLHVLFLILLVASHTVFGNGRDLKQNNKSIVADSTVNPQNDTLRWNAVRFTDLNNNQSTDKTCQFVTYGNNKIDWIQKNGNLVYSLTVNSATDGTWIDATMDGTITYNVSLNQLSGTLTITRSAGVITIVLKLTGGPDKISMQYDITNFDIL